MPQHVNNIPFLGRCLSAMDELPADLPEGTLVRLVFDQNTPLEILDQRIEQGMHYGLRMQLAPTEAPGYHPQNPLEANFVTEPTLMDDFCAFWENLAVRYAKMPVEFVLLHCPEGYWKTLPDFGPAEYAVMVRRVEKVIHAVEAGRPIVVDGMDHGRYIPTDLFDLASNNVALCGAWDTKNPPNTPESFKHTLRLWEAYRQATGQEVICLLRKPSDPSIFDAYVPLLESHQMQAILW